MLFTGKIIAKSELVTGTSKKGNSYSTQAYVLEYDTTNAEYPKRIAFEVFGNKINEFNLQLGEQVNVEIDFSVNDYNGKFYNKCNAWKVIRPQKPETTVVHQTDPVPQTPPPSEDEELPF